MNAVAMPSLDERVVATVRALAPCPWSLLLNVLKVDREPLDLSLTRLQRQSVIIQTVVGFDLRGKRLKVVRVDEAEEDDEISEGEKRCARCKDTRPLNCFTRHAKTKDKLQSWCKFCQSEDHRRRRAEGYPR